MPQFDPDKYLKSDSKPSSFDPDKYLGTKTVEKKNPVQNVQETTSQPLKLGLERFQAQVDTKIPSVLTEQGKVGYEQEIAKPRPKEKPILDFSAFKNAPKPRDAYYQDPTIAAREEKAKLKKLQTDYEAGKVDRNTFTQDLNLVTASGIDMLGRMASTIPSGILDNAIQSFGNQPGGLASMGIDAEVLGKITEKQLGLPEEYNPLSPNNALAETFRKRAELNQSLARKGYNGGITDALKLGEYKDAAKLLAFGFTESLPILLGLAATRGAGMSSTGSLISMGLGTQATTYQDLKTENPEIAKNILFLNATLTGIGEAGSEVTGTNLLYNQARKLFVNGQKEKAKEVVTKGIKEYLDYAFQKSFVGSAVLGDVSGEVSNQVWKNATDKWSGVRPDVDYLDGVGDAALISAFTTSTLAAGAKSLAAIVNPKTKDKIDDTSLKISNLQKEADNPDIPDAARTVIVNKIGDLTESINEDLKKDNIQYNNLDDDQKTTVDNLSDKRDEIKSALNNAAVSDETKQVLQNQLNDIDLQIESILPTESTIAKPVQEDVVITPETSSNYANMTEDDKGNFVFFHVGNKGYETIKPGTGASIVTSREESAALSKVGGLAMYYTGPNQSERQSASGARYAVKVPKEKVYDFNTDRLNFIEEAEARHEAENPGKAFDINSQLAYVTKIAGEKGFDMVVAQWRDMTRAQTTKELTPVDVQESGGLPFSEQYESNRQKGFEPVVPVAKSKKLQKVYDKIEKVRDKEQKYDNLYRLYYESNKYNQDEITELINNSDLPQEIKDEYKEILESKEETRRSQQTKPKEDAIQKQTAGQVPVQPKATVGEEVVQGEPKAEPKGVTEEGKEVVVGNIKDAIVTFNKVDKGYIYTIKQNGTNYIIGTIGIENKGDYYQIRKTKINDFFQQKGYATEAYKKIVESLDKPLISDKELTANAKKLWEKLVRDGVAEKYNKGYRILPVTKEQTPAQQVVGEKVKVENAPKGNHLNIGLNEGRTKKKMSGDGVLSKLPKDVKVISSSEIDVTKGETTLVVETSRPLTDSEMAKLLGDTKQQAIPQLSNGEGVLYDVKRGTKDGWGEFDPNLFILQDGKNLGEYSKTEGSKQKEVESNIETAIDLLDDINENKRKAERASSKRKAELESKIAEDTKELDNIPDATALVRSINDNFDAIKKELKEKGLLKIKC
jgi:hypothetical protein